MWLYHHRDRNISKHESRRGVYLRIYGTTLMFPYMIPLALFQSILESDPKLPKLLSLYLLVILRSYKYYFNLSQSLTPIPPIHYIPLPVWEKI